MSDRLSRPSPQPRRWLVLLIVTALLAALLPVLLPPVTAAAAGTTLFDNLFNNRTVDGTGTVTTPTPTPSTATNTACLSATGNSSTGPLLSCTSSSDAQGSGKLRLTSATSSQLGGIYGAASFPTSNGLDVTFNTYQYGGGGGDGMSFVLAATDPANPVPPSTVGSGGGSLGYSSAGSIRGLANAYLGVGLDPYGNFSSTGYQGSGCSTVSTITTRTPGAVVVRGPGNGTVGYCGLTSTYDGTTGSQLTLRATTRSAALVPVQVLVNPTGSAFTSATGVTVNAGTYKVVATPVGQSARTLSGTLPAAPTSLYPASSWVNTNGVPKQLAFGFIGSTGSVSDFHEASNVKVVSFNQVPQLSVVTTSYAVAAPALGDPVSYVLSPSVQTGANVSSSISVTQTAPANVLPLAAHGIGWVCAKPVGQTVTCTTSASSFAAGTTLPVVNVVGIVTGTGVTSAIVQNSSSTTISSADSNPGADSTTTAGSVPANPAGISLSPGSGSVAGGTAVTLTGSNLTNATAVEVGTSAEFQAGSVATLIPCVSGATTSCFSVSGTSLLVYMPPRASPGTVSLAVVTRGVAGSASYVYSDRPAAPAAPTATAGLTSATLTWAAPVENGRPITGYVVTPYLGGTAQTPVNLDPATLTRTIYGLTAGGSYTFTIAAVNALGTSAASTASNAVVPYTVLNAPTIGTVSAGTSSAIVRWTAPTSTGGAPITGYVVTPYIGTVAQTPRTFSGTGTTQTVTGLTPGTAYTFTVAARTSGGSSVLYRVNAGGPLVTAIDGGLDWSADAGTDNPLRTSGSLTTSNSPSATFDSTVPSTTPSVLFDTDRYDPGSKGNADEMSWLFPVTSGSTVKVRLYFANRYVPTGQVGNRVFDVSLDGNKVLDQFDMVAGAGGDQRATMREFTVTSDGTVNIDFTHEVENPQINGIEIIQTGLATTGPPSAASTAATPNSSPTLTFAAPPGGDVNLAYSTQLTVAGGTSPYTWSVSSGALPTGLTLNTSTGLLSGTPTASGTFNATIQVVDASGVSVTKAVTLVIGPALVLTFAPSAGEVSVAYSYQPLRTGGTARTSGSAYGWALTAGSLPTGLTLDAATGLISGTPTGSGSYPVTIAVTDAFQVVPKTGTIVIAALPTITSAAPPGGQVGVAYSSTFVVSGGTTPYVWSVSVGALPPGLVLDSATGVLSGTPTTIGTSSFTVLLTDAFGKTATKAVTLVVGAGPLVINKTANVSSVVPGGPPVTYTITIANTGTSAFAGVAVSDPLSGVLDDATYNADAIASSGTLTYTSSTLSWNGTVPASGTVTITYSVTATTPGSGNKVLTNTVSSSTLGTNCAPSSGDLRCAATVTVSGLSIVHTAGVSSTTPGSTVTFSIVATNTGQTSYAGAAVSESLSAMLDDATYDGNAAATSGSVSYSSPTLSWTGNLAVGASVTITYSVTVLNPDVGNRSLTGTVVSPTPGSTCPSSGPAASCTAAVTVLVPALSITSAAGVSTTTPGSSVPYTFVISNTGQTTYTQTSVSIALAAALDDATYNGNAAATTGTVVFDSGAGTLVWTGTLAPGAAATVTASVTVRDPDPGDRVLTTVASSSAAGSTCPVGSVNPACATSVQVRVPQLTIAKSSSVTSTTPGSVVSYTVLVTNSGQTDYTSAALTDALAGVLDDATYNNNAAATAGTVSFAGSTVSWTGALAIGASATITYSVTVKNPDPGDRSMSSSVVSTTPGSTCPSGSSDPRCVNVVTVLVPALSITTTTDVGSATPGQVVRYTVVVQNTGQTTYTSVPVNLTFSDVFDDATTNNDGAVSTGSLQTNANGTVVWTLSLAPGASATGTTSFTVNATTTRGRVMRSTVASDAPGSTCPTGSASTACRTTVLVLVPELTLTKTADKATVQPGGAVGYTIVVKNTGESSYAAAGFTDPLSGVLDDATYAGGAAATLGTVSYAAPNLSWTGGLAPGSSATITYTVTVRDPDPGDKRLANTVVSTTAGSNCASTSSDTRCTAAVSVLVPGLTIAKTASVSSTVPRAVVGYTITVTNSGATDYTGATFSDPLAAVLDDATYDANVATTAGTVGYAGSTISWSGNLVVGASATVTYSVTVHAADGGNDNLLSNTVVSPTLGSNCAVGSADVRCTLVVPVARLVLERVPVPPATTTPGSELNLSVRYTNAGKVPYFGIRVDIPRADSSDDLFATGPDVATSGTLVRTTATTQWTGDIPVGGYVDVTIIRFVRDPDPGNRRIVAPLQSDAPGSNCPTVGATDPRCTFLTLVLVPGLTITKVASATSVDPGAPIGYTLTIRNSGETPYTAAVVSDSLVGVLDDATYVAGNATTTTGSVAYNAPTLTWSGDLAVGATAVVTYSVTTKNPGTGDKTVRNAVSSTAVGSTCPPGSNNAACTTATSVLTPGLTIVKSASTASTTLGASVVFTVLVTNTGQTSYPAASFSDPLAAVLDDAVYVAGQTSATRGAVSYAGGVLGWSGALAVGESATISYAVSVNSPSTGDRVLANTVTSSSAGSNCAVGAGDGRCSVQVDVLNSVALDIVKTANVASTVPGATVVFTLRLTNPTDTTIFGATITDALGGILDDASYFSSTANVGVVSFTSPNLTWTGNVAARRTVTVTYTVTVGTTGAGDELLTAKTVSTSPSSSNSCLPGSTDPDCTVTVPVASLVLTQVANATSVTPGANLVVTAVYTNTGQVPYTGISVVSPRADTSDDTVPLGDQTASSGTLVRTAAAITWTGDIPVGGSVTVVRTLTVRDPDPGNQLIRATLQSDAPGNNCPTSTIDPRCTFSVAVTTPALSISKTASTTATAPGGTVAYTLTIHNTGQTSYTAASVTDSLVGLLDDAAYDNNASATRGGVTYAGSQLTWTGDLAVGQTATVTYSATARSPATGDKTMVNAVTSTDVGSTCLPSGGSAACRTTTVVLTPALTIQKTADLANVTLGSTVTYTLLVRNTGQTSYPAAQLTDSLSSVLDDAAYNGGATASSGAVGYSGGVLSWSGALAVGASATITYTVTVDTVSTGDRSLTNTVTSTTQGSNCAASSTDSRCTAVVGVTNAFTLTITKTADVTSTVAGGVVTYTVKLTNATSSAISGASYTDPLDQILDDATYDANAVADGGAVQLTGSNLTWSGTVPALATVTVTYSATVRSSFAGNEILSGTVVSTSVASNNCPASSTDARCASTVTVSRLDIQQAYTEVSTTPGSLIHLSATFTNTGQTPYEGITISSPSAGTVDDAVPTGDQTATSGSLVLSATAITWTGNIPVGTTVTVTGTLTVKNPDPGDKTITGTLLSSAPGNNCPAGGSDPRCTALLNVLIPGLSVSTSAGVTSVEPGGPVVYTVVIANTGQTAYQAAVVSDSLDGVLDDAAYSGNATTTSGSVSYAAPVLTWTGSLAVGASATVTFTVTTKNPDPGDKEMLNQVSSTEVGSSCLPGNGAASCQASVTVLTPGLTITKSADTTSTTLGASVVFTVVVANTGQTSYAAASFSDPLAGVLDDGVYVVGQTSATLGAVSYAGGVLGWSGGLAVGQSATVSYAVSVNSPSTGDRTLTNTVTSTSAGSNCAAGGGDLRCSVQVEVLNSVALSIVKTANVASTVPGGAVTFTLRLTNPTATTILGATVTDSLTDVLDDASYTGATANVGVVSFTNPNLTWTGNVAARRTVTVTYTVTVGSAGAGNELLSATTVSTSPSSSNSCLPGSTDPACTVTVPVASLELTQYADEATTTPGSVVHLRATYRNTGQVPYFGISVVSPRADIADDTVPNGDQTASSGTLVRSNEELVWTGDIPVGGVVTLSRTSTVLNPDPGNQIIRSTLLSAAPGNNCPTDTTDPRCTFSITVLTPGLTITTGVDAAFVVPNGVVGYTTTISNTGQTAYVGATVTDSLIGVLDDATYNGNAATTTGSVAFTSPNLTWTGDLPVGQQTTITFTVTAHRPADGDKTMLNRVSSANAGSTCLPSSGNAACTSTVAVRTPSLTTVVTADKATAVPGGVVKYTVTTTNDGQTDYTAATFDAPLADLLDDATYTGGATATSGSVVRTGDVLTWTGSLLQGASAKVTYSVTVKDPVPVTGNHRLEQKLSSVSDGSNCSTTSTDPRCSTSVPVASLRLVAVANTATAKPTDVLRYTSTFTNTGQIPYVNVNVVIDVLGAADDATYNGDASADAGVVNIVPGQPALSWTGDLAVGQTVTLTSSVTVNNPPSGDKIMRTGISTDAPGSNCPVGSLDPACTNVVTVLTPALTLTKTASTSSTTPGGTVSYTITAQNTGETAYTAARISDSLASVLTDATYGGNATATSGSVALVGQTLIWTGDLATTQTVTITYSVVINNPDLGDKLLLNRVVSDELGSTCPTGSTAAACTATVAVLVPALSITIAASSTTTTPGAQVGYTVTVSNSGQTSYTGATVSAALAGVLDDATYNNDATSTAGGTLTSSEGALTWTGDLAPATSTTITYSVTVKPAGPGNRTMTTSVTSPDAGSTCKTATDCVSTVQVLLPGLAVSTTAGVASTTPGEPVRFTITVHNTGETPYTGSVTTNLADVVDDATFDGTISASTGQATYAGTTLTWTGSLATGDTATIAYTVVVRATSVRGHELVSTVVADAPGSTCATGSTAPACTTRVAVLIPELSISKLASTGTTTPGGTVGYTIRVENTGETGYPAASVVDALDEVLTDADYNNDALVTGGGALNRTGSTLTWSGNLPVNTSVTITYSVRVKDPDPGDKLLRNAVTSSAPGSSCPPGGNAAACTTSVRVLVPALTITKTANTAQVSAGSPVGYTITVTNTGETAYAPATVTDDLAGVVDDAPSYDGAATATSGTVGYAGGSLTWTGDLGLGATATITYSVTVSYPVAGDQVLTNKASSGSPGATCAPGSTDARCSSTVAVVVPALSITKTADTSRVVAGGTVRYTIEATNTGQSDYAAATLSDSLTGLLDDAEYTGGATATVGSVSYADETLSWTDELGRGDSVVISYSVQVKESLSEDSEMSNAVVSTSIGSTCPPGGSDAACETTTAVEAKVLTLTDLTSSFALSGLPGQTVALEDAVSMTVTTNNEGGYVVSVQATGDALLPTTAGNPDSIPINQLEVRETGTTPYFPLTKQSAVPVHRQDGPSAPGGDAVTNDFQVEIPFVSSDTYSTELEYIVTAQ